MSERLPGSFINLPAALLAIVLRKMIDTYGNHFELSDMILETAARTYETKLMPLVPLGAGDAYMYMLGAAATTAVCYMRSCGMIKMLKRRAPTINALRSTLNGGVIRRSRQRLTRSLRSFLSRNDNLFSYFRRYHLTEAEAAEPEATRATNACMMALPAPPPPLPQMTPPSSLDSTTTSTSTPSTSSSDSEQPSAQMPERCHYLTLHPTVDLPSVQSLYRNPGYSESSVCNVVAPLKSNLRNRTARTTTRTAAAPKQRPVNIKVKEIVGRTRRCLQEAHQPKRGKKQPMAPALAPASPVDKVVKKAKTRVGKRAPTMAEKRMREMIDDNFLRNVCKSFGPLPPPMPTARAIQEASKTRSGKAYGNAARPKQNEQRPQRKVAVRKGI